MTSSLGITASEYIDNGYWVKKLVAPELLWLALVVPISLLYCTSVVNDVRCVGLLLLCLVATQPRLLKGYSALLKPMQIAMSMLVFLGTHGMDTPWVFVNPIVPLALFPSVALSLVLPLVGYLCMHIRRHLKTKRMLARIPHDRQPFLLGVVATMKKKIKANKFWEWRMDQRRRLGPVFSDPAPLFCRDGCVNLCNALDIEHVLKTNVNNYVKSHELQRNLSEVLGNGIFGANHAWSRDRGLAWRTQRKLTSRIFTGNNFKNHFMQCFVKHSGQFIRVLDGKQNAEDNNAVFDVQDLFSRYTLDCIGKLGFGMDLGCLLELDSSEASTADITGQAFAKNFDRAQALVFRRFLSPFWNVPVIRLFTPGEWELKRVVKRVDTFAKDLIEQRRKDGSYAQKNDLLSLFLRANDDQGNRANFSGKFLRDMILNVAIAGRDTTGSTLTWIFYMLGTHPEIERKLIEEIDTIMYTNTPCFENMKDNAMPYLHGCVYEALRLWPPVPLDPKLCVEEDTLPSGYTVPGGCLIQYHPLVMGRDPNIWPDPLKVCPERWIDTKKPSLFQFPNFQAGPRVCLGMNMAVLEAKVLTCMILQKYTLSVQDPDSVEMSVGITLCCKDGLSVRAVPRNLDHLQ